LSTSQIFDWTYASHRAYGQRIPCWHRWSVSRILRQIAEPVGRADTPGRPWLWRLKSALRGSYSTRANLAEVSRQVHLALFYDAQLDIGAMGT
jgi:hypothetical protein